MIQELCGQTLTVTVDVAPYHNRQIVVLRREGWSAWIDLTRPESELQLLRPLPAGSLSVGTVGGSKA